MNFLFIKNIFTDLFRKNFLKFIFLLSFIFATIAIFIPIIQSEYDLFVKQQTIKKTQSFNTRLLLPNYRTFSVLKENKLLSSDILDNKKTFQKSIADILKPYLIENPNKFNYFIKSATEYNNSEEKKNFSFETGFFSKPYSNNYEEYDLQSVHLYQGFAPLNGINDEIVVNEKFIILNKGAGNVIEIGDMMKIFDKDFKVVGIGDSVVNFILEPKKNYLIPNLLNLKKHDNLYLNSGIIYVNDRVFHNLHQQNYFTNYTNNLYLVGDDQVLKTIIPKIQNDINFNFNNFYSEAIEYQNDIVSGLRENIFYLEFLLFAIILLFASFFVIIFSIDIVFKYLNNNKIFWKNLYSIGYQTKKVTNLYCSFFFIIFLITSIFAYFFGFISNFFWTQANNYLFFVHLVYRPFSLPFFMIFTFLLSFIYTVLIWIYLYLKTRSKKERWLFMFYSTFHAKYQKRLFFQKLIHSFNIKKPLFILFLRNFRVKFFVLLTTLFIFFFFFSNVFINGGGNNFFNNHWNFLRNDVKSFTKFKNDTININKKTNKIEANVHFIDERKAAKFDNFSSLSLDGIDKDSLLSCIDYLPLEEIANQNLDCFLKNKKLLRNNLNNSFFENEMKRFGINDVYFNIAPYHIKKELPLLMFDSFSFKNEKKVKSNVYFMPNNWQDFFNLPVDFVISENGLLGVDSNGIQRAFVSSEMKKIGYHLNDVIELNYRWQDKEGNINNKFNFVISGFVDVDHLMQNIIFTDYNYLLNNNFLNDNINENQYPYNFIFSKTENKHLRHLVLNFKNIKFSNIGILFGENNRIKNIEVLSPTNQESLTIVEFNDLFIYSFNIVQVFLYLVLCFGLVVGLLLLFFLFPSMFKSFNKFLHMFLMFGYRLRELITFDFLNFLIPLLFSFFIAFILNYAFFSFISLQFLFNNIFFIFDFKIHFFYTFILFVFLLSAYFLYNLFYFYRNKKNLSSLNNE